MKSTRWTILILWTFLGLCHAQAQDTEATITIKQIILSKNVVVATNSAAGPVEKGKIFLATFKDNTQCALKVVGQNKNLLTLDTSECETAKSLTINQSLEPSLHTIEEEPAKSDMPPQSKTPSAAKTPADPLPPRTLTDLGYILPQGAFGIAGSFGTSTEDGGYYSGSTLISNVTTRKTSLGLAMGYGLSDNLNFTLGLSMVPGQNTEYSALNETYFSKGFEDPNLAISHRIISQGEVNPLDIVLALIHSPKVFEAKSATDKEDGTMGSGKSVLGFQLGTYRRFRASELGLVVNYFSRWAGSRTNAENGEVTEMGATETYSLRGIAQFKIAESFFLNAGLGLSSFSSAENKNTTTNTITRTSAYTITGVQAGARFAILPDVSSLDFTIQSEVSGNIDVTEGTTKITIKDVKRTSLGATISYLF